MIELLWKDFKNCEKDVMMMVSELLVWLTTLIATDERYKELAIGGYLVLLNREASVSTMIICRDDQQEKILQILQQPPEEFKERYVPHIFFEEEPVLVEKMDTEDEDDSGKMKIEIEET